MSKKIITLPKGLEIMELTKKQEKAVYHSINERHDNDVVTKAANAISQYRPELLKHCVWFYGQTVIAFLEREGLTVVKINQS